MTLPSSPSERRTAREQQLQRTVAQVGGAAGYGDESAYGLLGETVQDVSRMAVAAEQLRICRRLTAAADWPGATIASVALENASLHSAGALWRAVVLGGGSPDEARALAAALLGITSLQTAEPKTVVNDFAHAVSQSLVADAEDLTEQLVRALAHALTLHVLAVEGVSA